MQELTIIETHLPAKLSDVEAAKRFMDNSISPATRKAYKSDWAIFEGYCLDGNLSSLPASPETVAAFLANQANEKRIAAATLVRRLAAIKLNHELHDFKSPTQSALVSKQLKGIRRTVGAAQTKKAPATADRITAMISHCPKSLTGIRDRAILLLGFAGAFRRSELAALTVDDLTETAEGMDVIVRRSKTDQEGVGQTISIPYGERLLVVKAVQDWKAAAGIAHGPLFRPITKGGTLRNGQLTDKSIAGIVKKYAELAGLNAATFSGHSLRSGFITSAAESGATVFKIAEVSRHRSIETLSGYVRSANRYKDHAGSRFL